MIGTFIKDYQLRPGKVYKKGQKVEMTRELFKELTAQGYLLGAVKRKETADFKLDKTEKRITKGG